MEGSDNGADARVARRRSGCLLAAIAAGVVAVALLGIVVYYALRIWSAFEAPGSEALRRAGCDRGQVADFRDMLGERDARGAPTTVVFCLVAAPKPLPTCEAIARVYGGAVSPPPERFVVVVERLGAHDDEPHCSGVFDGAGHYLGPPPVR